MAAYPRHLRFNGAYWEQRTPLSGHPVWHNWRPVPWEMQEDISQYIVAVQSLYPGCTIVFDDLISE